jgi:hypothetical protein
MCFFVGFSLQAKNITLILTYPSTVSFLDSTVKNQPPMDVPIGQVAPHIPVMLKANGQDNIFKYGGYTYDKNLNILNLKNWITQYPDEVSSYNKVIKTLFEEYKNEANDQILRSIYIDAKAQYILIKKLIK